MITVGSGLDALADSIFDQLTADYGDPVDIRNFDSVGARLRKRVEDTDDRENNAMLSVWVNALRRAHREIGPRYWWPRILKPFRFDVESVL